MPIILLNPNRGYVKLEAHVQTKFSCHVIFEAKFLQMLFCTSFTKQFQYISLEQLPDCYAGKPLFTIIVSVGHSALKEDDVLYTFCGPPFLRCMVVL